MNRRKRGPSGEGAPRPRRSDGYEFAELRAYLPGDDVRRIDWAATARAGALQTRVLFEDHALMLAAAVDASGSMHVGRRRSLYEAAAEVVALWYGLAQGDDRCARIGDRTAIALQAQRGRAAARVCEAESAVDTRTSLAAPLQLALRVLPWDASLLIVSDFLDIGSLVPALRLCALRFDVTALVARDPWLLGLPLRGFVTLRDAESERRIRVFVTRERCERLATASQRREREIVASLQRLGIRTAIFEEERTEPALFEAFGLPA